MFINANSKRIIINLTEEELYYDYNLELENFETLDQELIEYLTNIIYKFIDACNIECPNYLKIQVNSKNGEIEIISDLFSKEMAQQQLQFENIDHFVVDQSETINIKNIENIKDNPLFKQKQENKRKNIESGKYIIELENIKNEISSLQKTLKGICIIKSILYKFNKKYFLLIESKELANSKSYIQFELNYKFKENSFEKILLNQGEIVEENILNT